jgi:hypothetical protein
MAGQRSHEGGYERTPRGRGRFERERDERGPSRTMPPREKDVRNELRVSSGKEGTGSSQLESGPRQPGKGGA